MINWKESAELNNCTIGELKSWLDKYPRSNKKIIKICKSCSREQKICFASYRDLCVKCTAINRNLKEKDPLPDGQSIAIPKNKNCSNYLGCLAEELLALTFKDVKRMPYANKGYDLICNKNFKIDVKSSATGHKGYWLFTINKNQIADYFLCIAFESRDGIIPTHVWLIPGKDINHLTMTSISKSRLAKWAKYEQPIERVLTCCNIMKDKTFKVLQPKGL